VAKEIARLDANDGEKLDALRQRYDQLARAVLRDHMHLVEKAVWRRFVTSEASFPEYISALAVVVDRWQKVLDVEGDE
jgi:hypothetical protein